VSDLGSSVAEGEEEAGCEARDEEGGWAQEQQGGGRGSQLPGFAGFAGYAAALQVGACCC
jgi:hypothetical protein